ncbi:hemin ABC transporter substrate-binding protein [marine bacterium AO1-C]|nr:hemin ABC transporter substrate-binding protein [marine bacterium AO1-C]
MEQHKIPYNMNRYRLSFLSIWAGLLLCSIMGGCQGKSAPKGDTASAKVANQQSLNIDKKTRIVSLNGTLTEILCALGYEKNIVGVDVTSTYPASVRKLPKVGHNRNIQAEGVLSLQPTLVIGKKGEIKPELTQQIKAAKIDLQLFEMKATPEGTQQLIAQVAQQLNKTKVGEELNNKIKEQLGQVDKLEKAPKVLFIYARGTGTMMVAGDGTSVQQMITLAGGQNAISGFESFKPLTAEALIKANPDVILMFDSGLKSLEGPEGLLKAPGVKETNAGRNKAFITMDGQFLNGFGPRLGEAALELNKKLKESSSIAAK